MSDTRPTCFISYSHEDMERNALSYLISLIQASVPNVNLLYDHDLKIGDNLHSFMQMLNSADAAIVLLTPSYTRKVRERAGGVYTEFTQIMRRHGDASTFRGRSHNPFDVFPVLFSGDSQRVIPEDLSQHWYLDFTQVHVGKNDKGNFSIDKFSRNQHHRLVNTLTDRIETISRLKSDRFKQERQEWSNKLFVNRKASDADFPEILVETTSLRRVATQQSYFLVGRKGSGKSTIVKAVCRGAKRKYKGVVELSANDDIPLGMAYSALTDSVTADIRNMLHPLSFETCLWEGFFRLLMIDLLLSVKEKLSPQQRVKLDAIDQYYAKQYAGYRRDNLKQAFFLNAVSSLQEFLEVALAATSATSEAGLYAGLQLLFTVEDYADYMLGKEVNAYLKSVISDCKERVLVTLDDFDSVFDEFRRHSSPEEVEVRAVFERDLLRALLALAVTAQHSTQATPPFFRIFDFCLTVPKDRFSEILAAERDSYVMRSRITTLLWSGVELCELLVKRFQKMFDCKDELKGTAIERLEQLQTMYLPELPLSVEFEYHGRNYCISLFTYILRHTFWRPRGVLLYYETLLAATQGKNNHLSSYAVRKIVSACTSKIIKSEFIEEYRSVLTNIQAILEAFERSPQVLSVDQLHQRIDHIPFVLACGNRQEITFKDKVEVLYDLGFIGLLTDENVQQSRLMQHPQVFYFTEGFEAFRKVMRGNLSEAMFVIHPIFTEYLEIDVSGREFMLSFDWEYLEVMDGVIAAAGFEL